MLDFTSALYLGLEHPSRDLPGWERLTLGKPAALEPPPGSGEVERRLAALVGCERALLAPSTLHLFWDLLAVVARRDVSIFMDAGAYPIARWGVERAAASGVPVRVFRQHDAGELCAAIKDAGRKRPVIVTDGFAPDSGRPAPLAAFLDCAALRDGLIVVDDTQAMGIFGSSPRPWAPYGKGGGGSLQHIGLRDGRILMVSSMAKAFGVPVAVLAGSAAMVREYERESTTRVHCSPPSAAAVAAAAHALDINSRCGDRLRLRLAQRVRSLRGALRKLNVIGTDSIFPVQPLGLRKPYEAQVLHQLLLERGLQTLLYRGREGRAARLGFVLSARHTLDEIGRAAACLADALDRGPWEKRKGVNGNGRTIEYRGETIPRVFRVR